MAADPARVIERNSPDVEEIYDQFHEGSTAVKIELVQGMICMSPAPVPRHQRLGALLSARLIAAYDRGAGGGSAGGWVFVPEPELHLGTRPDKMKPDLAAWRVARSTFSLRVPTITVAPDWVCEVLSPSTEKYDRGTKAPLYAEHGVEWLWFIDPETNFVEVFHNERGAFRPVRTIRDDESGGLPPFDSVTFAGIFAD